MFSAVVESSKMTSTCSHTRSLHAQPFFMPPWCLDPAILLSTLTHTPIHDSSESC